MNRHEFRGLSGLLALYATRMLGLFMVLPVLTLYPDQYAGGTTMLMGVALGVYGLTQGLLQIPLGLLSDRVGRKTVILGGMGLFLLGSLMAAQAESVHTLILGRALQGAGAVASTVMALLSDLTTEENRTKSMAAIGGSIGLAFTLAMVLGPVMASTWGVASIFWLTTALAGVGILLVLFWIPAPRAASHLTATEALPAPKMLTATLNNRQLLRLDFGVFVLHMVQMASWVAVPYFLLETFAVPLSDHWAYYLTAMGLGFVLMLPLVIFGERLGKSKEILLLGVLLLAVAELVLFAADFSLWLFAFGLLAFFTAFNLLEAALPSLVSKTTPSGTRGTAMGVFSSSQFLGTFAGGTLGGYIAQVFSHEAVFLGAAVMVLVWFAVASSMDRPKKWGTVIVDLARYPFFHDNGPQLKANCRGVEEITLFPDQQLMYLKVDKALFSRPKLDAILAEQGGADHGS